MQQVHFLRLNLQVDSDEEDVEIELVEEEAPFLKGHGRHLNDLSPVRIVKNPDGSLAQVCMCAAQRGGAGFTQPHSIHPFPGRHDAGGALQGAEGAEDDGKAGGGRGDGRRAGRQPEELERPHRQTQRREHIRE